MSNVTVEAPLGMTAERQAVVSAEGAAPDKEWVIVTRGSKREYEMGGELVRALSGVAPARQRTGNGTSLLLTKPKCFINVKTWKTTKQNSDEEDYKACMVYVWTPS